MAIHQVITDDLTGDTIGENTVIEIVTTNKYTGDSVVSHISTDTFESLLEDHDDIAHLFLHD